jgi:hypothetical protein
MEMTSTGDFISLVDGINEKVFPREDIDLEAVDSHLDNQEREAQAKYDAFDDEMARRANVSDDESLPKGWKSSVNPDNLNFMDGHEDIPEGWKPKTGNTEGKTMSVEAGEDSRGMESQRSTVKTMKDLERILDLRWLKSEYSLVLGKLTLSRRWLRDSDNVKYALWEWMAENEVETLAEEGEDILDGLETMNMEEGSGVSDEVLMDATEIITAIIVARGLESERVAPIFQKDGKEITSRINRIGRAEGIIRMREEMRKYKNQRTKLNSRNHTVTDFDNVEVNEVRRRDCSRRMDRGILRSDMVSNDMVQDKANKIQVIGSDVESLYPSLEAVEVAEIVYEAVLKTNIKFENVNWMEACKYIALTSTEQECRLGPLKRVLPWRRCVTGTRPGITGEDPMSKETGNQDQWEFITSRLCVPRNM